MSLMGGRLRQDRLQSGRLREKLRIEEEVRTANGQGGFTTVWSPGPTVWAEVTGLSGSEALKAGIERNVQQWRITIRRNDSVTAKSRLVWRDKVMNIKSVMPDPFSKQDATLIICESGG